MKYVKHRNKPAHEFSGRRAVCVECNWTLKFIVENRATRCPVAFQREQRIKS